jgi:ubiquinol-cytochrome c reductase cytochrome b subunit
LFYFALLALMPHRLENYVIILGPLLVGLVFIALPLVAPAGHRAIRKRPWALTSVIAILTVVGALTVAGVRANWSPHFDPPVLPESVVASEDAAVREGANVFHDRACISCHRISGYGGRRGPDLTHVGHRLTREQMTIRILNGGYNMPAYGSILEPHEVDELLAFLQSRR